MGLNAQTTVPTFTTGQVLTAAQQNDINTGIPVFATSVERDAAFGGTGEKTLAEGQFAFLEDTNATQFYDGSTWQPVGVAPGLVFIKSVAIGTTVSSVAVTDAFSATYDTYKIVLNGGVASAPVDIGCQLGATTTGYYSTRVRATYAGATTNTGSANGANFVTGAVGSASVISSNFDLQNPFNSEETLIYGSFIYTATDGSAGITAGYLNNTTSYTDFTLVVPGGTTITGGTIYVYGYVKA